MVEHLSIVLGVPLRAGNAPLNAAGFADACSEEPLQGAALAQIRGTLHTLIEAHNPYPAYIVDRSWNLLDANTAAANLTELFLGNDARPKRCGYSLAEPAVRSTVEAYLCIASSQSGRRRVGSVSVHVWKCEPAILSRYRFITVVWTSLVTNAVIAARSDHDDSVQNVRLSGAARKESPTAPGAFSVARRIRSAAIRKPGTSRACVSSSRETWVEVAG